MSPPFKTLRILKGRAIVADTFDYVDPSAASGTFGQGDGLAQSHHKDGYDVQAPHSECCQ